MPRLRANGVELYYEVIGEGDPLVLVHGGWGDQNSWRLVVDEFARSYQVVTYDRRGHSQSDRSIGPEVIRAHEEDLGALMEQLGIAPAHVVGNSIGGSIALRLGGRRPDGSRGSPSAEGCDRRGSSLRSSAFVTAGSPRSRSSRTPTISTSCAKSSGSETAARAVSRSPTGKPSTAGGGAVTSGRFV